MITIPEMSNNSVREFFEKNKPLAMKYIVKMIGHGVKEHLPKVELFKMADGTLHVVEQEKYSSLLKQAMDVFVTNELYEDAAVCRDLLHDIVR